MVDLTTQSALACSTHNADSPRLAMNDSTPSHWLQPSFQRLWILLFPTFYARNHNYSDFRRKKKPSLIPPPGRILGIILRLSLRRPSCRDHPRLLSPATVFDIDRKAYNFLPSPFSEDSLLIAGVFELSSPKIDDAERRRFHRPTRGRKMQWARLDDHVPEEGASLRETTPMESRHH